MTQPHDRSRPPAPLAALAGGSAAHPIMFWVLTTLALATFAPCVLVPVYMEVEEARDYEVQMRGVIAELQARRDRNAMHIQALEADPLVNERIARRELNQQPSTEQLVRVPRRELAGTELRVPDLLLSDTPEIEEPEPLWVTRLRGWLPDWPWRELFGKPANRNLLLIMAGGLLAAAFILFGRHPARKPVHG
jgi:hypothetical protein